MLSKVFEMLPSSIFVDFAKVIDAAMVLPETAAEASVAAPVTEDEMDEVAI